MCVDYRDLNKIVIKDLFPIPNIVDQIDGQFEYLKLQFGFCNSPSIFARFVSELFSELVHEGKVFIYLGDILVATETVKENLSILKQVFDILVNAMGTLLAKREIQRNPAGIAAVNGYPVPTNTRQAENRVFKFGELEFKAMQDLKTMLVAAPVLAIYSHNAETELHCDASIHGYDAILLQQQADGQMHPMMRCHSYEFEYLAIERKKVFLHPIKKGDVPFHTIHIDHVGPFEETASSKKHILVVIDAFTKYTRLYACKSVDAKESLKHVESYFKCCSRPKRIISDRGSAFTSKLFEEAMDDLHAQHIRVAAGTRRANGQVERINMDDLHAQHIRVAAGTRRANGQVERINRIIVPMLAKISPAPDGWDEHLDLVEFNINNTVSKVIDSLREILENIEEHRRDLSRGRGIAAEKIEKTQEYNTKYYNRGRSDSRGLMLLSKCLGNDRYDVKDVDGFQLTNILFEGLYNSSGIKPWTQDDSSTS
ncbi:Integrase core domain [Popillia japonica]|uniref:Integrase core domain n=1 Tax=Popillia japonica TaxID=7064 RepID=A0AAW1IUX0_POPJA